MSQGFVCRAGVGAQICQTPHTGWREEAWGMGGTAWHQHRRRSPFGERASQKHLPESSRRPRTPLGARPPLPPLQTLDAGLWKADFLTLLALGF